MDRIKKIPVAQVTFETNRIDAGDLKALAENIKQYGLQCPILVIGINNFDGSQTYKIIDGRRRFEACRLNGMTEIDAMVLTEAEANEDLPLILNTYRLNLSPVELYQQAVRFVKDALKGDPMALPPDKIRAVAAKLNLDVMATCRILNIGRLDKTVRDMTAQNKIPLRLALMTLKIPNEDMRNAFCRMCINDKPSTKGALEWIRQRTYGGRNDFCRDLEDAVFDTDECETCRHRSCRDASLFEDAPTKDENAADWCWNMACYDKKQNAEWQRFMQDAREKLGLVNIKKGNRLDNGIDYKDVKPVDKEKCKTCKSVIVCESYDTKLKIMCPYTCSNIKQVRDRSSSTSNKPTLKNRDKLTKDQKKEILNERFVIAARKIMVEEFLEIKERKAQHVGEVYRTHDVGFKKGKEPKDYKRILFFVGLFAGRNPFGWDVLNVNNDGVDMRKTTDKEDLVIMDKLDLQAVAKLNVENAADHLNSYDRANTMPEEIDNAIELLYGIKHWSADHYDKIVEKLSKTSKELLAEVKPWKPGWAK